MKEYVVTYYIFNQSTELRKVFIKANTLQDAIVIFNVSYNSNATLVKVEEFSNPK